MKTQGHTLVFYDGVCGLCDRFVHFLLSRDVAGRLRFAPLQGALAGRLLPPAGYDPTALDSVLVVRDWNGPDERVLDRSRAVLHAVAELGGGWRVLARAAAVIPSPIANLVYALVARVRYRLFGQLDSCPMPRPEWRSRFVDDVERGV